MDDLMLNRDHEILETVINSICKELGNEGFDKDDIDKFVLVKVKEYLALVKQDVIFRYKENKLNNGVGTFCDFVVVVQVLK